MSRDVIRARRLGYGGLVGDHPRPAGLGVLDRQPLGLLLRRRGGWSVLAGEYGPVYVYYDAFDSCVDIGSTAAYGTVGMRLIDTGHSDHVVNRIP